MKRLALLLMMLLPLAGAAQQAPESGAFVMVPLADLQLIAAGFELQRQKIEEQAREIEHLREQCAGGKAGI